MRQLNVSGSPMSFSAVCFLFGKKLSDELTCAPAGHGPRCGHNYLGHTYMGHSYIGHNSIGPKYTGHNNLPKHIGLAGSHAHPPANRNVGQSISVGGGSKMSVNLFLWGMALCYMPHA